MSDIALTDNCPHRITEYLQDGRTKQSLWRCLSCRKILTAEEKRAANEAERQAVIAAKEKV